MKSVPLQFLPVEVLGSENDSVGDSEASQCFPDANSDHSGSFLPKLARVHVMLATKLFVFCVLIVPNLEAQNIWTPHVDVNPSDFDPAQSALSESSKDQFVAREDARRFNMNGDFSELMIGIDETAVLPDLNAALEQDKPNTFVTMMGMSIPIQERSSHVASVTIGELAVPAKAHKALQKALEAIRKGRSAEARAEVAAALAIWPRYSDALILSALLSLGDCQFDVGLQAAEQAVQFDETNGMAHIVLAAAHNSKREYDDALRVLKPGLKFRPDAWQAYSERARAELGKRDFSAALADSQRAVDLAPPKTPVVHFLKGIAFINLNRTAEGTSELQVYLRMHPSGPAADRVRQIIERSTSTH